MKTLLTNWKDLLCFIIAAVTLCFLSDVVSRLSASGVNIPGLANLVGILNGFATFAAASACAWFFGIAVAWPTLNRFSNESFDDAWRGLSTEKRFTTFVVVACVTLIAAAICFSA